MSNTVNNESYNAEKLTGNASVDILKEKIPAAYASKADPAVKVTVVQYDDKEGQPTTDAELF